SRRRHTRSKRDWSSDVCSSDLPSLRFFDELLVLGLSLVVALLALGFGFLALGCELDIEVVAGLLRGLVASLGRSEQLIGLSLRQIGRASCSVRSYDSDARGACE